MSNGIYTAASGGLYALRELDVVSNNLANIDTVGFKAQRLVSRQQEFADTLASKINPAGEANNEVTTTPGVIDIDTVTDFTPGPIRETGNPLHAALMQDNQFFVVQTPEGESYTRAGNFTLNNEGSLVTMDGYPVLGNGGPINFPPDGKPQLSGNRNASVNGQPVGQLRVVEVNDFATLERTEGVRFKVKEGESAPTDAVDSTIVAGALEMPNVSTISAMVGMINAQKSFEAYTKVLREYDALQEVAIRNAKA